MKNIDIHFKKEIKEADLLIVPMGLGEDFPPYLQKIDGVRPYKYQKRKFSRECRGDRGIYYQWFAPYSKDYNLRNWRNFKVNNFAVARIRRININID